MEHIVEKLEKRVNDLIKLTASMKREKEFLQNEQRILQQEFKSLREKNKIAHSRIEQIVARLKSMEA